MQPVWNDAATAPAERLALVVGFGAGAVKG
jgi:hypothetical protein